MVKSETREQIDGGTLKDDGKGEGCARTRVLRVGAVDCERLHSKVSLEQIWLVCTDL